MNPKVKVVILNWNGEKLLKRCLDSVTNINYSNYQIISNSDDAFYIIPV